MQKFRDLVFTFSLVFQNGKKKRHVLTHVDCALTRKICAPNVQNSKLWEAEGAPRVI